MSKEELGTKPASFSPAGDGGVSRMDESIVESLKPKVEEIKRKIASGGGLEHEDIITLTIYTQFNHLNHLDMRSDSLDGRVDGLQGDFNKLRGEFGELKDDFKELRVEFAELRSEVKVGIADLRSEMRTSNAELRTEMHKENAALQSSFNKITVIVSCITAVAIAISTLITNILRG